MSEQEEYHSTDWKTMRKNIAAMRPYVRSFRRYTVPMLITGVLVSAIDAVYPLFRQYILDHYKEFQSYVRKKTEGGFHITKDAGIFVGYNG